MPVPLHIVVLCSRLDLPGGIERAVVGTANLLAEQGYRITLLVLDHDLTSFYPVSAFVSVTNLALDFGIGNSGNAVSRKFRLWQHVRRLQKKLLQLAPQVVLATEYPFSIAAYLALRRSTVAVFAWEHHHFFHLQRSLFWQAAFRHIYPKLQGVICLNDKEKLLFGAIGCKTHVIPNFVSRHPLPATTEKKLLTVGWLTKTKGIDLIPAIAERLFSRFPDWKWHLIGTGEEEGWLKEKLDSQRLNGRLLLSPPLTADAAEIYKGAALYVMPSRVECFPMVLLEAQAFGIPAAAFDCPTGPAAIIKTNENGILVPPGNIEAMADSLLQLMGDEEKRARFGDNAYRNVQRFSPEAIFALWQHLLQEIAPRG